MKQQTLYLLSALLMFQAATGFSAITNGDFSEGLAGWNHSALVNADLGGTVLYPDENAPDGIRENSILSQTFDFESYSVLSFYFEVIEDYDFEDAPETDYFYARLTNTLNDPTFLSWDSGDGFTGLGDGVTVNEASEEFPGYIVTLTLPSEWIPAGEVTLEFELLHDYSPTDPVTSVLIDNVQLSSPIAIVPVANALQLSIFGCALLILAKRNPHSIFYRRKLVCRRNNSL